jgi:nucleoid-associated protein YgaU
MYIHYLQAGQNLADVARQHYGNPEFARVIAEVNPEKLGPDGQARPGTRLDIPPLGSPVFKRIFQPVHAAHATAIDRAIPELPRRATVTDAGSARQIVVEAGDTLSELAATHLGSAARWDVLLRANRDQMDGPQDLRAGMTLNLPASVTPDETRQAEATATASPNPQNPQPTTQTTYTVQAGDNLTRIAARFLGEGERWDELLAANADQLDRPEALRVGMKLNIPGRQASATRSEPAPPAAATAANANPRTYTVQAGDNLTRIAARQLGSGDRWDELYEANRDRLASPDALFAGQTLRLP